MGEKEEDDENTNEESCGVKSCQSTNISQYKENTELMMEKNILLNDKTCENFFF